jgi:hypothetical protein
LGSLKGRTLIRRHIFDAGVLAELKDADVGSDAPPVVRFYPRGITRHRAETIRDDIEVPSTTGRAERPSPKKPVPASGL